MFDPNEQLDITPKRAQPRPERPLPQPIDDPKSQLWVPNTGAAEPDHHSISVKQQVKHLGNFLVPIIGIGLVLAVFGYLALILVGVYT